MKTAKKHLINSLLVLAVVCFVLACLTFFIPTKTTYAEEEELISLDFSSSTDKNNFVCTASSQGIWTVSDGVYKSDSYQLLYYKNLIDVTGIRYISFDLYLNSASTGFYMGFINPSVGTKTTAMQAAGAGVCFNFITTKSIWLASGLSQSSTWIDTVTSTDATAYAGKVSKVEIVVMNKQIAFSLDGTTIYSGSKTASLISGKGITLEDQLYFAFTSNGNYDYIDNFVVKDSLPQATNFTIDFENSTDAKYFTAKDSSTKWTVKDGHFVDANWGRIHYNYPISTTGTRVISFDMYITNGLLPGFGFVNASKLSGALSNSGIGLFWVIKSSTNSWISSSLTGSWLASKSVNFGQFYDGLHKMEIIIRNKTISFAIDGTIYVTTANVSSALTSGGITLEDNVYFAFATHHAGTTGSYIDNFEIRDYLAGVKNESFGTLDKLSMTGGNGGGHYYFDQDFKDFSSGSTLRLNVHSTNASGAGRGHDLTGADYISFAVDNQSGIEARFNTLLIEGSSKTISGGTASASEYGRQWTSANDMPFYLEASNGTVTGSLMVVEADNRASAIVPNGFKGRVVIPITSFESVSWSANDSKNLKFNNDANALNLGYIRWVDINYFKTGTVDAEGSIIVSDPMIYGDYIPAVANSANRVINAINNIGTVTLASEAQIAFAREQYDALENKTAVTNYATLEAAETAFESLIDNSYVIGADGKDFTGTGGVAFGEVWAENPATISAWIKVDRNITDDTHVGTIVGNMGRTGSNYILDTNNSFSFEITTEGNPKIEWRKSKTAKTVFLAENVDVRTSNWLHVAFTRDVISSKLTLYINGVKVADQLCSYASLKDLTFINPVMIGSDYTNDEIHALGFNPDFNGSIADVRVYSDVLTAEEIALDALGNKQDNLIASVDFASGESGEYYDSVGKNATDAFGWTDFASLNELNLGDYSFAVIPDTQMLFSKAIDSTGKNLYTSGYNIEDNLLYKNNTWLVENKDALGLKFVMHVGDLTDTLNYDAWATKGAAEMYYAMESMNVLTDAGIPWSLSRGNHDSGNSTDRLAYWDNGFTDVECNGVTYTSTGYNGAEYGEGSTRIANLKSANSLIEFGSMTAENMRNTYYTFQAGNEKWLVVALDLEPSTGAITWANEVISAHADHKTIITTHAYMNASGGFMDSSMTGGNYGETLWTNLGSKHSNVVMFLCGHSSGENVIRKELVGENGNTVWNFMIDYSQHEFIGNRQTGVFALFGIDDDGKTLHVNYLSPNEGKLFRSINQFTVSLGETPSTEVPETLKITDTDGNVALELATDFTGALPTLNRSGHIFLGYLVDGSLYKAGYEYTGNEASAQAVFAKLSMLNGASMRVNDPQGIRFTSYFDLSIYELIGTEKFSFGTIIAHATDITVSDAIDYSLLNKESSFTTLDIVSTVQNEIGNYLSFTGALVGIKSNHIDWDWVARSYVTVTYADGTTDTLYANVTDNARSIKEIAEFAYNDRSDVKGNGYVYVTEDGNYSFYDISVLADLKVYFE